MIIPHLGRARLAGLLLAVGQSLAQEGKWALFGLRLSRAQAALSGIDQPLRQLDQLGRAMGYIVLVFIRHAQHGRTGRVQEARRMNERGGQIGTLADLEQVAVDGVEKVVGSSAPLGCGRNKGKVGHGGAPK